MHDRRRLDEVHRYEWVYGLIDADRSVRAAALTRHRSLIDRWRPGTASGTLVDLAGAFVAARYDADTRRWDDYRRFAPYTVLFLQWELRFPTEWRNGWPYSPWSAKEGILAAFYAGGATPETGAALVDLLLATVHRWQRCQDRWYWRLARRLDSPDLRSRLAAAAGDVDDRTQLRARFVLWVLDHPEERVSSAAWRRWLRSVGRPVTVPAAASDLAAMEPAAVASMLADLAPADVARVLEGLHAGPAARILAAMNPVELAARAVELMDVRMAARALKSMDQPTAVGMLAAMDPSAAAARFPGSSRPELLLLMDTDAAVARLRAMTPVAAGQRLDSLPPSRGAALLARMEPAFAVQALAAMGWWGPKRTLSHMPSEVAAALLAQLRSDVATSARQDLDFELPVELTAGQEIASPPSQV
jgi:hypothetical protein